MSMVDGVLTFETGPTDEDDIEDAILVDTPFEEIPVQPEVELGPAVRGTCRVCGLKAYDGRAFYCNDHVHLKPGTTTNQIPGLQRPREGGTQSDAAVKSKSVRTLKKSILGANEWIVKGSQYLTGVPDNMLDVDAIAFETPEGQVVAQFTPHLREQFSVSDQEAELVARSMVAFGDSPTGKTIGAFAEKAAPIITLALGAGVLVRHFMILNSMRDTMIKITRPQQAANNNPDVPMDTEGPTTIQMNDRIEGAA